MSNQEQALNMVIQNIGQAYSTMSNFEVFPGLSLLNFLLVLLLLNVLITLFAHFLTMARFETFHHLRQERKPKEKGKDE